MLCSGGLPNKESKGARKTFGNDDHFHPVLCIQVTVYYSVCMRACEMRLRSKLRSINQKPARIEFIAAGSLLLLYFPQLAQLLPTFFLFLLFSSYSGRIFFSAGNNPKMIIIVPFPLFCGGSKKTNEKYWTSSLKGNSAVIVIDVVESIVAINLKDKPYRGEKRHVSIQQHPELIDR